ncbi:MAG: extracellular solute-binding protein, partial [Propionibacteriaceae bacterium]|nr:extracellular solute-binding protein [Propionibacteriaceae bacterium]
TGLSYATGIYYNKKLFSDNGLAVPTTWAEFVTVMDTLRAAGVTPFGFGGKDGFPAALPLYGLLGSFYPQDADKWSLLEGLWDGSVDLTTGVPFEVMERLQVIYDNSSDTSPGISIVESFGAFANEEFAMLFDGTWDQKSILEVVGSNFEIGMFPLPGSDSAADNRYLNGKLELQLCVADASQNKEAALKWLDFYSQPENYTTFAELSGFAPSQPDISTGDEFLASIADYTGEFRLFWEAIFVAPEELAPEGGVGFAYDQLVPIGTKTPAEAAASAQAAWAAVR